MRRLKAHVSPGSPVWSMEQFLVADVTTITHSNTTNAPMFAIRLYSIALLHF